MDAGDLAQAAAPFLIAAAVLAAVALWAGRERHQTHQRARPRRWWR